MSWIEDNLDDHIHEDYINGRFKNVSKKNKTMIVQGKEFNQVIYDRLNDAIEGHENTYSSVDEIMREFPMCDIEKILTVFIDDRKRLIKELKTV